MGSVGKAFLHSFGGKYISLAIQMLTTVILARLLTPEEFGLFTICYIIVALAEVLRESGVGNYIIKEQDLTNEKIKSAFSLLLITSTTTAILVYVGAYYISEFYDNEKILVMLHILCINLLVTPFGSIVSSILRKELNFFPILVAGVSAQLISSISMIVMAYNDFDEITLVYGAVIYTVFNTVMLQFFRPEALPRLPGFGKIIEIFQYSKFVVLTSGIGQLGHHMAEMVVGKHYSMDIVGQLNRASSTAQLFNRFVSEAMAPVVTPYISKMVSDGQSIQEKVKILTNVQLNLAWPFFVLLAIYSKQVISILFGSQWDYAGTFLSIYCVSRILFSIVQHINSVLMGMGLAKELMRAELMLNIIRILVVLISIQYGILVMLTALATLLPALRIFVFSKLIKKELSISVKTYMKWLVGPMFTTIATIIPFGIFYIVFDGNIVEYYYIFAFITLIGIYVWYKSILKQEIGTLLLKYLMPRLRLNG